MVTGTGLQRSEVICASVHSSLHTALFLQISAPVPLPRAPPWPRFKGHLLVLLSLAIACSYFVSSRVFLAPSL